MGVKRVALAGYYGRGNFGDDLMAVIFGQAIRKWGIEPRVFGLCEPYAGRFGFEVAQTPGELLDDAGLLVWGGGGALVSWCGRKVDKETRLQLETHAELLDQAKRRGVRTVAVSVGGSGDPSPPQQGERSARLLSLASWMTVRNKADLALPRGAGIPCGHFPDIVWRTSELFPAPARRKGGRLRIGVDIYFANLRRHHAEYVVALMQMAVLRRPDIEFIFIDSTNRACSPYRCIGRAVRGANVTRHQFEQPDADLELLGELDAMISTRLHIPIVCLQYGVPVACLFSEGKTRLLLDSLGLLEHYYGHHRAAEWAGVMLSGGGWEHWIANYRFSPVAYLRDAALGHLRALEAEVSGGRAPLLFDAAATGSDGQ
ncbi:MAG: polysaccharide pyruvyl transferase family protein [Bryobacteraceae bacterium]|nr:polysaccharide pyruvyl transferase family protein [Bryobacteraceae bacterium]